MKRDMRKYILRKLVELIFTLLFVTLLSFLLMRLSSVDPATAYAKRMIGNPTAEQIEKIRIQLGFDKPLLVQYGRWVWDLLHFDLGVSLANGHDVWTDIATAFPKTLGIVALASIFQVVFIVIVSCIAFLLPWKLPKKAVRLLCILGVSIPSFYLATVYLDYFAVQKSLISVAGNTTLLSYISPAICIGVFGASFYTPLLMDALEHESNEDSLDGIEGAINDGNTLTRNLVLNASSEILSDLKVRQAIAYAVNKEEITKGLTYGYETPATSLFAPGAPYTDITYNSTWSYDLDKANALLDEAGWVRNESTGIREKDGQQLSLNYTYWTDLSLAQDMALAIKTQLAEVGIDVTTTGQDQMTWWTEGVAGNYDITTWNTEGSYTEPHKFLQESLGADPHAISLQALEDFQSYSDAVNAFSTSANPEVVQSAIATALNVSNDNVIDLPISYSKDLVVYNSSKIAGYTFSSVPQFFEIDNVQPAE
ncbi:ABC transporter substrate-binding protein [Dorea longicatena]|uniref:ABC transporter substrate-binding protein n=1 Tax=Dorea longicatena TaxID=88431 RepID=UPI001FB8CA46|nr:ABC transporter substrate-binding protein [Dorea longicatena]